jgi:hypothetical protein
VINFVTDIILLTAFTLRIIGLFFDNDDMEQSYHFRSFQVLSCVAPLIWVKLVRIPVTNIMVLELKTAS